MQDDDFKLKSKEEKLWEQRKKIDAEYYTLWFTETNTKGNVQIEIDNDLYQTNNAIFSTALLTSSLFDANYEVAAGTHARGINILLDNQWLAYLLSYIH